MNLVHRAVRRQFGLYDKVRHPRALELAFGAGTAGGFGHLRGEKHCLLLSYRRSGEPVPTPVWFGLADGKLYLRSLADGGKIKRIRREPRVQVGPCDARGRPTGPLAEGSARILSSAEAARAESVLRSNYGWGRRIYKALGTSETLGVRTAYVEVSPAHAA